MKKYITKFISILCVLLICIQFSSCSYFSEGVDMKLSMAMDAGSLEAVKEAVADGANIEETTWSERTLVSYNDHNPVSMCIDKNQGKIAEYLLDSGADPNYSQQISLLMAAVSRGDYDVCKKLIEKGADVNFTVESGNIVRSPICSVFDIERINEDNETKAKEIAKLLIDNGAEFPDGTFEKLIKDINGNIPAYSVYSQICLHIVQYIVKLLLEKDTTFELDDLSLNIILGNSDEAIKLLDERIYNNDKEVLIVFASAFCNTEVISKLQNQDCNLNNSLLYKNYDISLLDIAVRYNTPEVAQYIYGSGVNLAQDVTEQMSVCNSKYNTCTKVIEWLRKENQPCFSDDVLLTAVAKNNVEYMKLAKDKLEIYDGDSQKMIINSAAEFSAIDALTYLKSLDYDFNYIDNYKFNLETLKFIFENGCDVNRGNGYYTPLYNAIQFGDLEKTKYLVEHGAKVDGNDIILNQDDINATPLHLAISKGDIETVKYLLDNGANIEIRDGNGNTPLLTAVESLSYNIAKLLIERGADTSAKNNAGMDALALAESNYFTVKDQVMVDLFK